MRILKVKLALSVFVLVSGLVFPVITHACSCGIRTLNSGYQSSDNVFTAVITGGEYESQGSRRGIVKTYFEKIEVFKGNIPFKHLDSQANGNTCGISLQVGVEYLFFVPDSGKIGLCSGIRLISTKKLSRQNGYVDILRAYASGKDRKLSEPWFFYESDDVCNLEVVFDFIEKRLPSRMGLSYRKIAPQFEVDDPSKSTFQAGYSQLQVSLPLSKDLTDHPIDISVQDDEFVMHWEKTESFRGSHFLRGDDVRALVDGLSDGNDLHLEMNYPADVEHEASISRLHSKAAIAKMRDCIFDAD